MKSFWVVRHGRMDGMCAGTFGYRVYSRLPMRRTSVRKVVRYRSAWILRGYVFSFCKETFERVTGLKLSVEDGPVEVRLAPQKRKKSKKRGK